MKNAETNQWITIGRTETIKDNLNPNFKKTFVVDYIFEVKQQCRFQVLDDDGKNSFDEVGECQTTIGAIVGAKNNIYIADIQRKGQSAGNIVILSEATQDCRDHIYMQWKGVKLKNVDGLFDKSDPFLRFKRVREDKMQFLSHETEVIMDNLNPIWKPFEITGQKLYNGDKYRPIKLECWDWQKNQNHQFIGECQFSIQDLLNGKKEFELYDSKQKKTGNLQLINFNLTERPTFLDYIRGNTQINVVLAVDFTASNGAIQQPNSLHYINPNNQQLNQYQQAILSVGEILLDYDFDKKVPCYGFGGHPKFPNFHLNGVSHCFPLSGNPQDTEALGTIEILNLYRYSLQYVSLSGPTLFGPILQETLKLANLCKSQGSQIYTVLLILTDGEIHDMENTIEAIIEASNLPLSVIIIGVGNSQFDNMQKLDGDNGQLAGQGGRKPSRDLVQFVPFRNANQNPIVLAQQVLAEVPDQLVKYMIQQGIKPTPPTYINQSQAGMGQTQMINLQQQ
ncbi:hypothetical protein IMG5_142720 [Ichthyophthirius multifiliis]|uniref:C2 domain-containing protein n=1 Tax=Ichthyophthirius multifiliis TaxID=5932 RepID=G0QXG1_ICHMU|nr:hypothetical protein IMG5_142720 [Ichthyophthirius multifiliis]EGR30079.1 hypothetical protein IMG5_142720 [Ichthyophthirius multifiliis]|eukprot:XP_004031315.1 hypothetical protein IMG5_142720 [Ichthyophthirius multifiliis]